MNDPEVTMHDKQNGNELTAHRKAVEAASIAIRLFDEVRAMTWRLLHPSP